MLNAGNEFVADWDGRRFPYLDRISASRMWEAYRIFGMAREAWLVSSEGTPRVGADAKPSGATTRDALVNLGVPPSRVLISTGARNTHEEAIRMAPMIRSLSVDHVVLVTSHTHLRRALGAFRTQGIDAIPGMVQDPAWSARWSDWLTPTTQALPLSGRVVHEILGLAYYRVRGWSSGAYQLKQGQ